MTVLRGGPDPTYWGYQRRLAREFVLPFIESNAGPLRGRSVLDLGCGEGGVALEALLAGAQAVGLDLNIERVERGRNLAAGEGHSVDLRVGDVNDATFSPVDVVILRDVIEHLRDPAIFLAGLRKHLQPEGVVYVSFPPYYSPFGLHQQLLPGRWMRRLPWLSWLPPALIRRCVATGTHAQDIRDLATCRLTIGGFESAARQAGFELIGRQCYLLRPAHSVRFGWPVISAQAMAGIPGVREILVSGVSYLLGTSRTAR